MGRILLIQPPLSRSELFARGSQSSASLIPPLGLAYIAAFLKQAGHMCEILDGVAQPRSLEDIVRQARGFDLVGISVVSAFALRALELIAQFKASPGSPPIVVGGPHVTALPGAMAKAGADFEVIGEGEVTMKELVEWFGGNRGSAALRQVPGLGFMEGGTFVTTGRRPRIEPLDRIPLPDRDLLPMHLYRSSIARASAQPSHSLLASRGCPGVCSFCSKLTHGTRVRYFSPDRILDEFFLLRDRFHAKDVAVWDDNFVANPAVALEVCEGLKRKRFGRTWSVEARIDGVNRHVLEELATAGCSFIAYGIESGSQRVLDYMHKRISLDQIREVVAMTKEIGIPIRGYFMLGMPGETLAEMEETVRFALELDVEIASFTLFIPLPGTQEYRRACRSGSFDPLYYLRRITPEFNFPDDPIYVPEGLTSAQLLEFHRQAYNRYYFRPKVILRKVAGLRRPQEVWSLLMGAYTLAANAFNRQQPAR